jgi:hypothetical protein
MKPMLTDVKNAGLLLGGIGKTKTYELINEGILETVSIGSRRLVTIESIERLVDVARASESA